jgi:hypothetical protein
MTDVNGDGPVPLWEGPAAMFATPEGGRVIRYQIGGKEEFLAIPAELVPALEMLRANPQALQQIANSPMGAVARRMAAKAAKGAGA